MLVLAPSPELLALLAKLVVELEPLGALAADAVAAIRDHLADHPGDPIPHRLIARAVEATASLDDGHPAHQAADAVMASYRYNPPRLAKEPSARPTAPATPSTEADASPAGGAATPTAAEASAMDSLAKAAASLTTAVSLAEAASKGGSPA